MAKAESLYDFFSYFQNNVKSISDTKLFAGIMIIILNIGSRFVNIKISKTLESYLKHTFSRDILLFAIVWMGSRDIFVALGMTILLVFLLDYILNEESPFCCFPEQFTSYHLGLLEEESQTIQKDEIEKALDVLEKAKKIINSANENKNELSPESKHIMTNLSKNNNDKKSFSNQFML